MTPPAIRDSDNGTRALLASELEDAQERLHELIVEKKGHSVRAAVTWTIAGVLIPLSWVYSPILPLVLTILAIPFFTLRGSRYDRRIREVEASIEDLQRQLAPPTSGAGDA